MFYQLPNNSNPVNPTAALLHSLASGEPIDPWCIAEVLARLYPYNPPVKPRTVEGWVSLACADKRGPLKHLQTPLSDGEYVIASDGGSAIRPATSRCWRPLKHLQTPLSDGEYVIASDGVALHAVPTTAPAGQYSRTGERLGDLPAGLGRWRDVVGIGTLGHGVPFSDLKVEFGLSALGSDYVRAVRVTLPDGEAITVQRAYYDRAVTLPGRHVPVRVCILPNRAPTLRIETTCGLAVIAGIHDP